MKKAILIVLLLFSLSQIYIYKFFIDYNERESGKLPDLFYLPEARYIKPIVLSYSNAVADIVWIQTISYFADQFLGDRNFKYLEKLLYITAGLDPIFEKMYIWGGSILLYNGKWITKDRVMASSRFLEYGWTNIKNYPYQYRHAYDYWRIPQMIGFNYAIELKEPAKGVPFIEEVANIPGAPSFYRTWVSTLLRKSGDKKTAMKSLERELIIENLKATLSQDIDKHLKTQIIKRLRNYYAELYDKNYAEQKLSELLNETQKIQERYLTNYRYLPLELFFVLGADTTNEKSGENLLDKIYYE
jgi:hypothetical protein